MAETAQELGEQCLTLAEKQQDSALLVLALRLLSGISYWRGAVVQAHEHCERGITLYNPHQHRALAVVCWLGPRGGFSLCLCRWTLWFWGARRRRCNAVRRH